MIKIIKRCIEYERMLKNFSKICDNKEKRQQHKKAEIIAYKLLALYIKRGHTFETMEHLLKEFDDETGMERI